MKSMSPVAFFGYPSDTKSPDVVLVFIIVLSKEKPVSDPLSILA